MFTEPSGRPASPGAAHWQPSTLGAEMALADAYLRRAASGMGRRLYAQVCCAPELKSAPFPPMVLLALVENAVRHGAAPSLTPVVVQVSAYAMRDHLIVDVQDDGVGLGPGPGLRAGRGLRHSRARLAQAFGGAARLSVASQASRGVLSRIAVACPKPITAHHLAHPPAHPPAHHPARPDHHET